jgi:predicted cobalt transporter CbtA
LTQIFDYNFKTILWIVQDKWFTYPNPDPNHSPSTDPNHEPFVVNHLSTNVLSMNVLS